MIIGKDRRHGNLYILDLASFGYFPFNILATCLSYIELWHYRLGHPSNRKLQNMINELQISSIPNLSSHYSICPLAKQRCLSFPSSNNLSLAPFDLIHYDVWSSLHVYTIEGFRYFLTIVSDCTHFTWVYFLQSKLDVITILLDFFSLILT